MCVNLQLELEMGCLLIELTRNDSESVFPFLADEEFDYSQVSTMCSGQKAGTYQRASAYSMPHKLLHNRKSTSPLSPSGP